MLSEVPLLIALEITTRILYCNVFDLWQRTLDGKSKIVETILIVTGSWLQHEEYQFFVQC